MTTLFCAAADYDALTAAEWDATVAAAQVPVMLGEPTRLRGDFDADGVFVADEGGPEWVVWDDPRLTEDHAIAVAVALED